jgi:hypothetical protein
MQNKTKANEEKMIKAYINVFNQNLPIDAEENHDILKLG